MIIPPAVEAKHAYVLHYVNATAQRVRDIVSGYCSEQGFAYIGRVKGLDSLAEKLETGRFERWSQLDDLFACAIVIPTLLDEERVLEFLRDKFIEVKCLQRATTRKDPSVFRFDATRFIGELPHPPGEEPTNLQGIKFEIQIRTAFEHAWSVTTHALAYKGSDAQWRHKRLAAQLRAAVEQLDQVVVGFEQWADVIKEQRWAEIDEQALISQFMTNAIEQEKIPSEAIPSSLVRFSENLRNMIVAGSKRPGWNEGYEEKIRAALQCLAAEIDTLGKSTFPRSLSLFQFCLGVFSKNNIFDRKLGERFVVVVTNELQSLYPEVEGFVEKKFDFEDAA